MNNIISNIGILTEALFYIALILSCPFVYVVAKRFGSALASYFLSRRKPMTVNFVRDGEVISHEFSKDVKAEEVVKFILNSTNEKQSKKSAQSGKT